MPKHLLIFMSLLLLLLTAAVVPALAASPAEKDYIDDVLEPETYLEESSFKLIRGLTNIVTSPGEIPKQMVLTIRDRGALGVPLGFLKGIGMTVMRAGIGAWETVSFPAPNSMEGDFTPILKPEFVWNPSPTIRR
jgi:putative exosortase-associated protein (TIGR04073 family)